MGAFILAGIVFAATLFFAIASEFARGMASAPSMIDSQFWPIMFTGTPVAVVIAVTHWLPHIGW